MKFHIPTKLYEEPNCVWNHRAELAALGKKALIVTGRHSARVNGSLDDVINALSDQGTGYAIFDQVEENPSVETVMAARKMGLAEGVDFVIGIGGGSPMDAAKAIAVMVLRKEKDESWLYDKEADSQAAPVVCVPTTCGTGSEATAAAVLTLHKEKTKASIKHRIFPTLSLVDGKYLKTASMTVICDTAVDALGHLWESYINAGATDYSRMFVREGLNAWKQSKDILLGARQIEDKDFQNLMHASTLAGMSIAHTGTSLPHGLSYAVTYETGMAHGKAVGHFLAGYLAECKGEFERLGKEVLSMAGFATLEDYETFYAAVCGKEKLPEALLKRTVSDLLGNRDKLKNCPYHVDEEILWRMANR